MAEQTKPSKPVRAIVASGLMVVFVLLYIMRPDFAQALHWWPMIFWTPVVFLPFATLRPRRILRSLLTLAALWLACVVIIGEPSWRVVASPGAKSGFRVVSLNCAGGTPSAAAEAFAMDADVVLLQEVGPQLEFEKVKGDYDTVAYGPDAALFVRHRVAWRDPATAIDHAMGTIELGGRRLRVVSLRLLPPVFRLDWWSPDCWRNYSDDVVQRRVRLREFLKDLGPDYIFGGDFNATNPKLGGLVDGAHEAHRSAGQGWSGTGTNDFPFVRVDQIWGSASVSWRQAFVRETVNSDHRMVVADFELK